MEAWVGSEAEAVALARAAGGDGFEMVEEGLGQEGHEVVDAGGVALLVLVAMLL